MASDLTPCPTCQSMLRIPANASMIRCPKCKTVLAIEPEAAAPPAAAAPPLPFGTKPAAPAAPPLPFGGKPAVAGKPAAPAVAGRATVPPPPAVAKPRLAAVQPTDLDEKSAKSDAERERLRQMRKALRKMEEDERREEERYEELTEQCKHGRNAATALAASVFAQAGGALAILATIGVEVLVDPGTAKMVALAGFGLGVIALIAAVAGFGLGLPGPEKARHIAVAGIVVTVLQGGLCLVEFAGSMRPPEPGAEAEGIRTWADTLRVQTRLGIVTNLPLLAETPARALKQYPISILAAVVAALEFARLVMVCLMMQYYATDGKDPEMGHESMACVNRIFWMVLLAAMFRVSAAFGFDWMPPGDTMAMFGKGMHVLITIFGLLFLAINLLWAGQLFNEVKSITDPRRYVLENARLNL